MPDPCLGTDPCIDLSSAGGNLVATVHRHPGAAPAYQGGENNGLVCTGSGLWAPPQRFSWVGSATGYGEGVSMENATYGEFIMNGTEISINVVNSNADRPMCLLAVGFAEGRLRATPNAIYDVYLRTRLVVAGAQIYPEGWGNFATPSKWRFQHTGAADCEAYWSATDVVVMADVPPGQTATYHTVIAWDKQAGPGGGYLEGAVNRIQFFAGHQL